MLDPGLGSGVMVLGSGVISQNKTSRYRLFEIIHFKHLIDNGQFKYSSIYIFINIIHAYNNEYTSH